MFTDTPHNKETTLPRKPKKSKRGFASWDPAKQREVSALGGRAQKSEDRHFARNPEAAREAGRKSKRGAEE